MKDAQEVRNEVFENVLKLDPHFDDASDMVNAMELGAL